MNLRDAIAKCDKLGIPRVRIADACQMSAATVDRWATGTVIPHFVVQEAVIQEIERLIVTSKLTP